MIAMFALCTTKILLIARTASAVSAGKNRPPAYKLLSKRFS